MWHNPYLFLKDLCYSKNSLTIKWLLPTALASQSLATVILSLRIRVFRIFHIMLVPMGWTLTISTSVESMSQLCYCQLWAGSALFPLCMGQQKCQQTTDLFMEKRNVEEEIQEAWVEKVTSKKLKKNLLKRNELEDPTQLNRGRATLERLRNTNKKYRGKRTR